MVTNATFKLVANSTATLNEYVKRMYGMPLYKLWWSWKSHQAASLNHENDGGEDAEPMPETDFLFPQSFGDYADMLKWPLIIMHVVAWVWAGCDNRFGSYLCDKFHVKTPWFLKEFLHNRSYPVFLLSL